MNGTSSAYGDAVWILSQTRSNHRGFARASPFIGLVRAAYFSRVKRAAGAIEGLTLGFILPIGFVLPFVLLAPEISCRDDYTDFAKRIAGIGLAVLYFSSLVFCVSFPEGWIQRLGVFKVDSQVHRLHSHGGYGRVPRHDPRPA